MHINGIGFINTISRHILFATESMIKNIKVKNIEYRIKQVQNLYLQPGFKVAHIHAYGEFEPPHAETDDLGVYINCASKE